MKITVSTKQLRSAIEKLSSIPTGMDSSMQAMVVAINADIDGVTVTRIATSCGIKLEVEGAEVSEDGTCYVGLESLKLTAKSTDEQATIETDGKFLRVSAKGWKATLKTIASLEIIQGINPEGLTKELTCGVIECGMQDLVGIFNRVSPAADAKGTREKGLFRSIALIPAETGATVASTDGRRFHFESVEWSVASPIIIPLECTLAIGKIIGKDDGRIKLEIGEGSIRASGPGFTAFLPLLEPRFPSLQTFLSIKEGKSEFTANRGELKEALQSAVPFHQDATVYVESKKNKLCVTAAGQTEDRFETSIKCSGGDMGVSINAHFLLNALAISQSENVTVMLGAAGIDVIAIREGANMAVIALIRTEKPKD